MQLVAAVFELFLRLNIEQNDLAGLIYHHHRVGRRFQQTAIAAFHLRQMLVRLLAHADVADRRGHQDSFGAFQRAQHHLDRKLAAVLAQRDEFNARADLLRQRVFRDRRSSAISRSAKPSGMMLVTFCPSSSSRR